MLGCGAHVIMLRRTQVAHYPYEKMVSLEQLEALVVKAQEQQLDPSSLLDALLLPMDTAVADFPEVNVPEASAAYLMQGQAVRVAGLEADKLVRITLGAEQRFVGIGSMNEDGLLAPKRLIVIHDEPKAP